MGRMEKKMETAEIVGRGYILGLRGFGLLAHEVPQPSIPKSATKV